MSAAGRPGFFIAVESFTVMSPPVRLFAEHLVSNIAAYLALQGLPPVPVTVIRRDAVEGVEADEEHPVAEDAVEVVFDPLDGFVAPRQAVEQELAAGGVVITDRFLHHMDVAMPGGHLSASVEDLLFSGELQADCVIFLASDVGAVESSLARHADEALRQMSEVRPEVHVVQLSMEHTDTCDEVWKCVKECLKPWLAAQ